MLHGARAARPIRSWLHRLKPRNCSGSGHYTPAVDNSNFICINEAITLAEEAALVAYLDPLLKRRRYEKGHWDSVIIKYKEVELPMPQQLPAEIASIINRLTSESILPSYDHNSAKSSMLAPHLIDLAADGFISPHVDNVRHSGPVLAGLSLLSSRTMRLQRSHSDGSLQNGGLEHILGPRSLYMLKGPLRYDFAHSILCAEGAARRLSLIFRDAAPSPTAPPA